MVEIMFKVLFFKKKTISYNQVKTCLNENAFCGITSYFGGLDNLL